MDGLFSSPLVQTVVGVVTIWFLAAMLCSGIVQLVGMIFGFKANHLWRSLTVLLSSGGTDGDVARAATEAARLASRPQLGRVQQEPIGRFLAMVPEVAADTAKRVSRITPSTAISALIAARDGSSDDPNEIESARRRFAETPLGQLVEQLPASIRTSEDAMQRWFSTWFDGHMETLRIRYRSRIRWWAALIGIGVAFGFGINSLQLTRDLYNEPARRAVVLAAADRIVEAGDVSLETCGLPETTTSDATSDDDEATTSDDEASEPDDATAEAPTFGEQIACVRSEADALLTFELSWFQTGWPDDGGDWADQLLGMAITAGAIAAGSTFWFDVLKRLMGLRPPTAEQKG
jgi:hypothetical protein